MSEIQWVPVGGGHLSIGHRPKIKAIPTLGQHGATHLLTLLSEAEGAADIGAAVKKAGLNWLWFPMESADPPERGRAEVLTLYENVRAVLAGGGRVFVHCSAGIHRTGMMTYGLLRSLNLSQAQAMETLRLLREMTAGSVGQDRLSWGEQFGTSAD